MPASTYKTMTTPEIGPRNEALEYGGLRDANHAAEAFIPDLPADKHIGITAEILRQHF